MSRLFVVLAVAACSSRAGRATDAGMVKPADAAVVVVEPADAAKPPPDGLVDVTTVIPDAVLDLRYATANNLTGAPVYPVARCLLRVEVAAQLARAADAVRAAGHRLLLWDCYRPASAQQLLWDRVHDPRYVAEPSFDGKGRPVGGSVHSRAAAVDVSLADAAGVAEAMPTDHDFFGPAAHRSHPAADPDVRARAALLDRAMTDAGFEGLPTEWWHYGAANSHAYPLLDLPLL